MIRCAGELIEAVKMAVIMHRCVPETRIIAREGDFGAERVVEHVKVREGRNGMEIILQTSTTPNPQ